MTTAALSTKAAELDAIIENLQAELDACPNRAWDSAKNQRRLDLLIEYVAKRDALDAEDETETFNGDTTMITIQQVTPSHSGFGEFDLSEAIEQPEFNSVEEFVDHACSNGYYRDEDCDEAAAEADGAIHGQGSGKVVGLMDAEGDITLWCVYVD